MLHLETVDGQSFAVLKKIMVIPELQDFCLVGGTALSLIYGHRISEDLDLFSNSKFENVTLVGAINTSFDNTFQVRTLSHFGIFGFIKNLKIDIVRFPHPLIRPTIEIDGVRMFSMEDIIAMKVQAILGRAKKKDFWDIAELLKHFTVKNFIELHKEKYATQSLLISVPLVMIYFDDAEDDEDPISLKGQTWKSVKSFISLKVREYLA